MLYLYLCQLCASGVLPATPPFIKTELLRLSTLLFAQNIRQYLQKMHEEGIGSLVWNNVQSGSDTWFSARRGRQKVIN